MQDLVNLLYGYMSFKKFDWFHSVGVDTDSPNTLVVYVKYLTRQIYDDVPERFMDKNVKLRYSSWLEASRYGYTKELPVVAKEPELSEFEKDLAALKAMASSDVLQHLFFEAHDGDDAITDFYYEHPAAYDKVVDLYDKYGFDVLFEHFGK